MRAFEPLVSTPLRPLAPEFTMILLPLAGFLWIFGFAAFHGPLIPRRKIG